MAHNLLCLGISNFFFHSLFRQRITLFQHSSKIHSCCDGVVIFHSNGSRLEARSEKKHNLMRIRFVFLTMFRGIESKSKILSFLHSNERKCELFKMNNSVGSIMQKKYASSTIFCCLFLSSMCIYSISCISEIVP